MGLAFLGGLKINFESSFERLLIFWIAVVSIPFLIVDSYDKTRIVYDLPLFSLGLDWGIVGSTSVWVEKPAPARLWLVSLLALVAAYSLLAMLLL